MLTSVLQATDVEPETSQISVPLNLPRKLEVLSRCPHSSLSLEINLAYSSSLASLLLNSAQKIESCCLKLEVLSQCLIMNAANKDWGTLAMFIFSAQKHDELKYLGRRSLLLKSQCEVLSLHLSEIPAGVP